VLGAMFDARDGVVRCVECSVAPLDTITGWIGLAEVASYATGNVEILPVPIERIDRAGGPLTVHHVVIRDDLPLLAVLAILAEHLCRESQKKEHNCTHNSLAHGVSLWICCFCSTKPKRLCSKEDRSVCLALISQSGCSCSRIAGTESQRGGASVDEWTRSGRFGNKMESVVAHRRSERLQTASPHVVHSSSIVSGLFA